MATSEEQQNLDLEARQLETEEVEKDNDVENKEKSDEYEETLPGSRKIGIVGR